MSLSRSYTLPNRTVHLIVPKCLATTLLYGLYNLYLHPLRAYPGPPLYAAYRLPYVVSNMRGRLPQAVLDMHRKYGPIVRIAPNELAYTSPEAWNDIYGLQHGRVQNPRDIAAYTPLANDDYKDATGMLHASDAKHARLRRIIGQAFTPKAIEGLEGMLLKYADLLVEQLALAMARDSVQDMSAWFNFTTFDLMGGVCLWRCLPLSRKRRQDSFFPGHCAGRGDCGLSDLAAGEIQVAYFAVVDAVAVCGRGD